MRTSSLSRYFAVIAVALLAIVSVANFLLEPSTGARILTATSADAQNVRNIAPVSQVERTEHGLAPIEAQAAPVAKPAVAASAEPAPAAVSPSTMQVAPAALSGPVDGEAARAVAAAKAKIKAEQERKKRAARERARQRQMAEQRRNELSQQQPWAAQPQPWAMQQRPRAQPPVEWNSNW